MKKVLSGMIAAVMTICMSVSVFASPNSSVSIKNNDSKSTPVTYEYAPELNISFSSLIKSDNIPSSVITL